MDGLSLMMADAKRREAVDLKTARASDLWPKAIMFLRAQIPDEAKRDIRAAIAAKPNDREWLAPYHFFWGMAVRNNLRHAGFGEQELGIDNLDNVYGELIEEALRQTVSINFAVPEHGATLALVAIRPDGSMRIVDALVDDETWHRLRDRRQALLDEVVEPMVANVAEWMR